jgi:hypothetical protein
VGSIRGESSESCVELGEHVKIRMKMTMHGDDETEADMR